MVDGSVFSRAVLLVCISALLFSWIPAAHGQEGPDITINASSHDIMFRDNVTFSGTSNGFTLYFFLTGPGLDPDGVLTFDIHRPAKTKKHASVVPRNNEWEWVWSPAQGRVPVPSGNYTLHACIGPFDIDQLRTCERCKCVTTYVNLSHAQNRSREQPANAMLQEENSGSVAVTTTLIVSPSDSIPAIPSRQASSLPVLAGIAAIVVCLMIFRQSGNE